MEDVVVDDITMETVSYIMVGTYRDTKNMDTACSKVAKMCPNVKTEILQSMWMAIDAYVDLHS